MNHLFGSKMATAGLGDSQVTSSGLTTPSKPKGKGGGGGAGGRRSSGIARLNLPTRQLGRKGRRREEPVNQAVTQESDCTRWRCGFLFFFFNKKG